MKFAQIISILFFATMNLVALSHASNNIPVVVVELFTSQGCESCPPAEAYLKELGKRDDVIALEYHIDYWDYIGWNDPFADPAYTRRQKDYAAVMEERYVYTPQMVLNGKIHEVGSKRSKVDEKITALKNNVNIYAPNLSLSSSNNDLSIEISTSNPMDENYNIIMVGFDGEHITKVTKGENRGENLVNTNVVRSISKIGIWAGSDMNITTPMTKGDGGCVVMLQHPQTYEILTAASMEF